MTADLKNTAADGNTDVVLAEGLFTLWHPPLFELLDLKLFIDCRADESDRPAIEAEPAVGPGI